MGEGYITSLEFSEVKVNGVRVTYLTTNVHKIKLKVKFEFTVLVTKSIRQTNLRECK